MTAICILQVMTSIVIRSVLVCSAKTMTMKMKTLVLLIVDSGVKWTRGTFPDILLMAILHVAIKFTFRSASF